MKNLQWLDPTVQIDFLQSIWRTDFFREKAVSDPWLSGLLKRVTKRPHAVAEQSSEFERLHFSTFWNVWIFHEHDNPYIFDLGVLHELLHTLLFQSKRIWSTTSELWSKDELGKMERAVSLRTEVCIYKRWPELRQHTFPIPIWADAVRFDAWSIIKSKRLHLMQAGQAGATFENHEEQRIAKYAKMNQRWNVAWREYGPLIESAWCDSFSSPLRTAEIFSSLYQIDRWNNIPFFTLAKRFGATKTLSTQLQLTSS